LGLQKSLRKSLKRCKVKENEDSLEPDEKKQKPPFNLFALKKKITPQKHLMQAGSFLITIEKKTF